MDGSVSDLNLKQSEFTLYIARLLVWGNENGVRCLGAEWHRTPEQAALNAKLGKGVKNSNHIHKLALDIFCLDGDGDVTWAPAPYQMLADKWLTMHPLARWGGHFTPKDYVHYSFEHNGVK